MPTYICKAIDSDISFSGTANPFTKVLSPGTEPASTFNLSIAPGGAQINVRFVTDQGLPSSDAWESGGSITCELRVTAASNMRARAQINRISAAGVILQTGTFTAFQNLLAVPATFTFSAAVPTWTAADEACGNRLAIRFNFDENTVGLGATATIEVGTTNSEIVSTISENSSSCRRVSVS